MLCNVTLRLLRPAKPGQNSNLQAQGALQQSDATAAAIVDDSVAEAAGAASSGRWVTYTTHDSCDIKDSCRLELPCIVPPSFPTFKTRCVTCV